MTSGRDEVVGREDRIGRQNRNVMENQHNRSVNTEGREVARRKLDVKEGEDAPGYASELRAARGHGGLIVIRDEGEEAP